MDIEEERKKRSLLVKKIKKVYLDIERVIEENVETVKDIALMTTPPLIDDGQIKLFISSAVIG